MDYYNYNENQQNNMQPAVNNKGLGISITSLILGIISLIWCCCCGMGFLFGTAAIICAIIGYKKSGRFRGTAIAGLVCGIVGLLMGCGCDLSFWIFGGGWEAFFEGAVEGFNEGMNSVY